MNTNLLQRTGLRFTAAFLLASLSVPAASAQVRAPIAISLSTADEIKPGTAIDVYVVIEALQDVPTAHMRVSIPEGWRLSGGTPYWSGWMQAGEVVQHKLVLVPGAGDGTLPRASVDIAGWAPVWNELQRTAAPGQKPSLVISPQETAGNEAAAEPVPLSSGEIDLPVPLPAPARPARVPGQPAKPDSPGSAGEARAASQGPAPYAIAPITVKGRFIFIGWDGNPMGVRNATVELRDRDWFPYVDETCGTGVTDIRGYFSITGACFDGLGDLPDYYVRIILNNSVVEVKPADFFAGSYTFDSGVLENSNGGEFNFGDISITQNGLAFELHNLVVQAWQFMGRQGVGVPKVLLEFPAAGAGSTYTPASWPLVPRMSIVRNYTLGEVFHEYGHHLMYSYAAPDDGSVVDYSLGGAGHRNWLPEYGNISWIEGWADYFASLALRAYDYPIRTWDYETHDDGFTAGGQEDHIEGFIAAILHDLVDSIDDDQHLNGAGQRDVFSISFWQLWNVMTSYSPSPSNGRYHIATIHEFYEGMRSRYSAYMNLVAEVFCEHHIKKPQPDLFVLSTSLPAGAEPGGTVLLGSVVKNIGAETAAYGSLARHYLVNGSTRISLGDRTVNPWLLSGDTSSGTLTAQVPPIAPGTYYVEVCADFSGAVPESNEKNNCYQSTSTIQIAAPGVAQQIFLRTSGGFFVTAENGGGGRIKGDGASAGDWETFTLVDLNGGTLNSGDTVTLQAANRQFLAAEGGGGSAVNANRLGVGEWERFTVRKLVNIGSIASGDAIALQAANGMFVVAEGGGGPGQVVNANRTGLGPWETFTLFKRVYFIYPLP